MAVAKWDTPRTRSANIASTVLNGLANGSESAVVTYDNSGNKDLYCTITLKLGSINTSAGASIQLKVGINDGTDVDNVLEPERSRDLEVGSGAKVAIFRRVVLDPHVMLFSFVNNSGQVLASSGNEIYVTAYNEASA